MKRLFLSFLLTLFFPVFSETYLSSSDIAPVMDRLFELHIDQKEMSTTLLGRSLKIYIQNFDPSHCYLLQEETRSFLHPYRNFLDNMLVEYQQGKFSTYFSLNESIQKSIYRAREWRGEWERDPHQIIAEAKKVKSDFLKHEHYAATTQDLKQRHHQRFLAFVRLQMEDMGESKYQGKERKLIALCEKQLRTMENEYLGLDDQGRVMNTDSFQHRVVLRTLKSLANSLDAHTAYYSPDEAYAIKVQLEKGMCGIGVVLREGIDGVTIQELVKGGPAENSGNLLVGDTIIEVDGESIQGLSFHKVLEVMRGKEGSKTILGVLRQTSKDPEFLRVNLVRSKIVLGDKRVDIEAEPFGDGVIGKIKLHSFYEGDGISSEQDLKDAIDHLRSYGPLHGLVLDMRENSGGFLSQAVRVSGLFVSSGVVVISKYFDGSVKYYRVIDGSRYYDGPLVVLISRNSASATEIVAQTLKDYGVAVVVGDEQTFGKGTIQHQTVTDTGRAESFFKVTVGRYYTVSGQSTQIDGVKADIHVPSEYYFENLGEGFLDFPLPADQVAAAFDDPLTDIDPFARKWFQKYYVPTLQKPQQTWATLLPILKENSQKRIAENRNYQLFLEEIKLEIKPINVIKHGSNDLQMEESVNIVKDMIFLTY